MALDGRLIEARAVTLDAVGRPILAGMVGTPVMGGGYHSTADFGVARFTSDGRADATFGGAGGTSTAGLAVTNFTRPAIDILISGVAAAQQSDGKFVVAGNGEMPPVGEDLLLARYNRDGSLDPTFGEGGRLTADFSLVDHFAAGVSVRV